MKGRALLRINCSVLLQAIQCSDLIRQQTVQYGTVIEGLVEKAFTVKALPNGKFVINKDLLNQTFS